MKIFGEIGVLADDGEKVQCHICGRMFVLLATHVIKTHNLSSDEYRSKFGLKRKYPLAATPFRDSRRELIFRHLPVMLERSSGFERLQDPLVKEKRLESLKDRRASSKMEYSKRYKESGGIPNSNSPEANRKKGIATKVMMSSLEMRKRISLQMAKIAKKRCRREDGTWITT